jgi:hypothetical protein
VQEWKAGLDDAAPYERLEVGLPAQERAYDDAIAREFTGILITALAVIPAIALTVDFLPPRTSREASFLTRPVRCWVHGCVRCSQSHRR